MSQESNQLSGKHKRHLRSLGNRLEAKIVIGHNGLSKNCLTNLDECLKSDELVKVRVQPTSGLERKEAAEKLVVATSASCVQVFGSTVLLYRENSENIKIKLP
jgi:RNA-binding protein